MRRDCQAAVETAVLDGHDSGRVDHHVDVSEGIECGPEQGCYVGLLALVGAGADGAAMRPLHGLHDARHPCRIAGVVGEHRKAVLPQSQAMAWPMPLEAQ